MLCDDCLPNEAAIGRARAQGFNIQRRSKADLDKLQAERRARPPQTVVASQIQPLQVEPKPEATPAPAPESVAEKAPVTEPSQSAPLPQPETPSDFPCPCGSTLFFKECCGWTLAYEPLLPSVA